MYNTYFGFREKPFKLVPNPDYLFLSKSHEIALAHLTYATEQGEGFVVITGEVGTGKTTLCRNYLELLDEHTESAYIFNPKLDSKQLLEAICQEFGITTPKTDTKSLLEVLYAYLIKKSGSGKKVVLVIDEAQGLSTQNLELVRMLSNLETTRNKLLQIVMVGQPELDDKLRSHELRQLAQRISLSYHLSPLSVKDSHAYIKHRLAIAAQRPNVDLFTDDACRLAYRFSRGIPRLINIVCDRALLTAFTHSRSRVTRRVMHTAISELTKRGRSRGSRLNRRVLIAGAVASLLIILTAAAFSVTQLDFGNKLLEAVFRHSTESDTASAPTPKSYKIPLNSQPVQGTAAVPPTSEPAAGTDLSANAAAAPMEPQEEASASSPAEESTFVVPDLPARERVSDELTVIDRLLSKLDPLTSRKNSVARLLAIWHQPRPNAELIPDTLEDSNFFEIIARQYGLRSYEVKDNWPLISRLDLPGVVAFRKDHTRKPVYLLLVGRNGQRLYFEDGKSGERVAADLDVVQSYVGDPVYIFWKNTFGYDMTISSGSEARARLVVKNMLRQIGYHGLEQSPAFDSPTLSAIKDFQARHKLLADGLVGPLTKIMLLRESGSVDMPTLAENERPPS